MALTSARRVRSVDRPLRQELRDPVLGLVRRDPAVDQGSGGFRGVPEVDEAEAGAGAGAQGVEEGGLERQVPLCEPWRSRCAG